MVASSRTFARTAAPEIRAVDGGAARLPPVWDPRVPLSNLALVGRRVDSIRCFLANSIDSRTDIGGDGLQAVSSEIASAVQQIILNGAALLAFSQPGPTSAEAAAAAAAAAIPPPEMPREATDPAVTAALGSVVSVEARDLARSVDLGGTPVPEESRDRMEEEEDDGGDYEIVEMDAVELLAEHVHFCEICGKGFKRDANLRMHMRAHGNQFKTLEALSKPDHHLESGGDHGPDVLRKTKFSCPFLGCNRNRNHKRFRPLKSAVCVKNHFRRSHCPKIYSCTRCNKKNFSVLADLKSHLKHCGECRWRCSCGTSFSRKDKLFGHMALFEGHMPAVSVGVAAGEEDDMDGKGKAVEEDVEEDCAVKDVERDSGLQGIANGTFDPEFFEEFMVDGFGQIDGLGMDGITWIDF